MKLQLITAPAAEPVSLAELKVHLRIDHSDEDIMLAQYLSTARTAVETLTLHKLVSQTWDMWLDEFPPDDRIVIPFPPLISVTGVYYTPENGVEQTFSSSNYTVDTKDKPGAVVLKRTASWAGDTLEKVNGVRVRFVSGFGGAEDVDIRAKQAIYLLAGHYYKHREEVFIGQGYLAILLPRAATALCNELRYEVKEF